MIYRRQAKMKSRLRILLCVQLLAFSGCVYYVPEEAAPNSYYISPEKNIRSVGRVALVKMNNLSKVYFVSTEVTESLFQEIQKQQIFGLIRVDDNTFQQMQLQIDSVYSYEQLALMKERFHCDAILMGTITEYKPYPHMLLGLRLRLIDLSDGQLLWAMEQVWDTTDKSLCDRIETFYDPKRTLFCKEDSLKGQLGIISSLKFFKFVAHEVSQTLLSQ